MRPWIDNGAFHFCVASPSPHQFMSSVFGGFAVTACVQASWAGSKVCANEPSLPLCCRTCPEKSIWQTAEDLGMHPSLILASPHSSSNSSLVIPYVHSVCSCMEKKEKTDIYKQRTLIWNSCLIFGLQIGNYLLDNLAFS